MAPIHPASSTASGVPTPVAAAGALSASWPRYTLATLTVGATLGLHWAAWPADGRIALVTFFPAVVASALLLGPGPGLLAASLSAASVAWFHLQFPGSRTADVQYILPFAAFVFGSGLTCFLAYRARNLVLALRENDERFRELSGQSHDVIWIVGLNPVRVLYVSPALERIWGITPARLYQDPSAWEASVHPDDQKRIYRAWDAACTPGTTEGFEDEYRIVQPDGSTRWLSDVLTPVRNAAGEAVRLVGISRDITVHKQVEEALSSSETRYRTIFENANTGIAATDATGRVVNFNEAFRSMIGYDAETLMRMNFADFTHRDDLRLEEVFFNEILAGKRDHYRMEKRYIAGDGRILWVDLSSSAIRDAEGKTQRFVAVIADITARREAETHLRLAASVVDNAAEGIVITDRENKVISVNAAFTQITGYAADEAIGRNPRLLAPGAQVGSSYERMWASIQANGRWQGEVWDRRKDGEPYCQSLSISAVRDEQGRVSHYCGVFADITSRKRAEQALQEKEARLRGLYQIPHVGLALTDLQFRYLEVNAAFRGITGYSDDELRALDPWTLTPRQYEAVDLQQLALAKRTGRFGPYEKEYVRKDGSLVPLQLNGALFTASDGAQYLWMIVEDVSERKHLERAVLEAADRERRSLGADLHDGLGQELTGISLLTGALAQAVGRGGTAGLRELARLEALIGHAIHTCRTIAHGLSPLSHAGGGLVEALQELVRPHEGVSYAPEMQFAAVTAAPLRLPPDAVDHLYRIAQEAIANAQRHAKAKRIDIRLEIQPATVRLEVQDDGVGVPAPVAGAAGMGQQIMQFRSALIGARLSIGPGDRGGTLVAVECPQPPEMRATPPG